MFLVGHDMLSYSVPQSPQVYVSFRNYMFLSGNVINVSVRKMIWFLVEMAPYESSRRFLSFVDKRIY